MGLLSAIAGGLGDAGEFVAKDMMRENAEEKRAETAFQNNLRLLREKLSMDRDERKKNQEEMNTLAKGYAEKRQSAAAAEMAPALEAIENGSYGDRAGDLKQRVIDGYKTGLLGSVSTRDMAQAQAEMTGNPMELLKLDETMEERKLTRESIEQERRRADQRHEETLKETKRYHDMLSQDRADARAARKDKEDALSKLPEASRLQVASTLRTIEKLEGRYYSLKPSEFESPEAYKAERADLRKQIDTLNARAESVLSGKPQEKPKDPKDLFPDLPKKDGSKTSSSASDVSNAPDGGFYTKKIALEEKMREIESAAKGRTNANKEEFMRSRGYFDLQKEYESLLSSK